MKTKKHTKLMLLASLSLVIIIWVTAFVCGARFRLVQHRTTRKLDGQKIPEWLDSTIDFLGIPSLIWKVTLVTAIVLFCIRLYQINHFEMILVALIIVTILLAIAYRWAASITSSCFSKRIFRDYGERTIPEC